MGELKVKSHHSFDFRVRGFPKHVFWYPKWTTHINYQGWIDAAEIEIFVLGVGVTYKSVGWRHKGKN